MNKEDRQRIQDKMLAVLVKQAIDGNATAAKEVLRRTDDQKSTSDDDSKKTLDRQDRDTVLAWVNKNNASCIDAVRHFWDSEATYKTHRKAYNRVRYWMHREVKSPGKPEKGTAPALPIADAPANLVDELQREIQHAEQARSKMAADHSWSAWQLTSKYLRNLRDELRAEKNRKGEDFDPHDDEQVIEAIVALPAKYLADDRILQAVMQARE